MRFSLRGLIVAVVILGLAVTAGFLAWENRALRTENREYRLREGILKVEDPSKIHVVEGREQEDLRWRWKVYMPPDSKNPQLRFFTGTLQPDTLPTNSYRIALKAGEIETVEARIRQKASGGWSLVVSDGGGSMSADIDWVGKEDERPKIDGSTRGERGVVKDRDCLLIRMENSLDRIIPSQVPSPGICIWVEADSKK